MYIPIDQEVIDQTEKCKNNFACLKGDADCLGKVDYSADHQILFVKSDCVKDHCSYYLPYRNSFFCWCPTRNEIFERYQI